MTTDFVKVRRDATTKAATLAVNGGGQWEAFAGKNAASVDFTRPVAAGTGSRIIVLPEAYNRWMCFAVKHGGGVEYAAERHLPMAGGYNFRDLGGFVGDGGKRIVWGKFFRADDLASLTDSDLAYLASIPIVTLVDFRTDRERSNAPNNIPKSVKNTLNAPVAPGFLGPDAGRGSPFPDADSFMLAMYRDLALDPGIAETYRRFFARAQSREDAPMLFHCSAGKDRTGIGAAFILAALGVDRETIFADYEASNIYLGDKYARLIAANPQHGGLFRVKRAFLAEAFSLIKQAHGSIEGYLTNVLDVDIPLMRREYLC